MYRQICGKSENFSKASIWRTKRHQGGSMIGTGELIVILCVVLVLFGGKKLPELARSIGLGIREFKKACQGSDEEESLGQTAQQMKKEPVTIVVESEPKDQNPHG